MGGLPGDYIAGFTDGEGCFALKFRRDVRYERKNKPEYFYWDIEFAIYLKSDDGDILKQIRDTLDCGRISITKNGATRYAVNSIDELYLKIIPFFTKFKLRAKKRLDFELWKEAVFIFKRNQRRNPVIQNGEKKVFRRTIWAEQDLKRLKSISEEMKKYKSKRPIEWKWISKATQ